MFIIDINKKSIIIFSHIGFEQLQYESDKVDEIIIMKKSNLLGKNIYVKSSINKTDLHNTPSSVTLFNSKSLSILPSNHFEGIIEQISNFNYSSGTSRPRYFQIRGIGERSHYAGEGPPNYSVGFLMDEIDFSGIGMIGHLFDVNQIEIFKGPQSIVFGPNAMAGSINITTNNPTPFYTGKIELNSSSDNGKTFSCAIGGPILNSLSFRLAGSKHSQDGFRKNIFLNREDTNSKNESFLRTKFCWQPLKSFSFFFTNFTSNQDNNYDAWAPNNNKEFITYTNRLGKDSQKSNTNAIKIDFKELFGFNTLYKYSNTTIDIIHSYDSDWGNDTYWFEEHGFDPSIEGWSYDYFDQTNRIKKIITNELIINSNKIIKLPFNTNFVIGFYSSNSSQTDNASGWLFGGDATDLSSEFKINSIAYYKNINSKLNKNIEFNFNMRYENYSIFYLAEVENIDVELPRIDTTKIDNFFGLNFSINNKLNKNLLLYSSFTKGYKAGGINQHPELNINSRFYKPEFTFNSEIGGRLSINKIKINFAIFNMKRNNIQVQVSSQQDENNPNSFTYYTSNAKSGLNSGFELETEIEILPDLNFKYSLGYLYTFINEFSYPIGYDSNDTIFSNPVINTMGKRDQAMAPNFNSSFIINYHHKSGFYINSNITSKDEYYFSDSHNQKSSPYSLINLDFGYININWKLSFWGKNITDHRYPVRGFYFGLEPPEFEDNLYLSFGNPKEIGIKLSYKF